MENVKRRPEREPTAPSAVEHGVRVAFQLAGFACVVLAFWAPGDLGIAVAGSGCSALLTLAIAGTDKRRRLVQILAASVALVVAVVLLVESRRSANDPRVPVDPPAHVTGKVVSPPATPGKVAPKARELAASAGASSDGIASSNAGDRPAEDVGGVKLPDLGEGNPFEKVAMTQAEMDVFVDAYVEFWSGQKELLDAYSRGELSYSDYFDKVMQEADQAKVQIEGVMGTERVAILTTELQRYLGSMAMNMGKVNFSEEELRSQLVTAVQHLAKRDPIPSALTLD